jgi:hypothetical protein
MSPVTTGNQTLSELYPNVERLTLFVAFEEADAEADPNYQQIIFAPGSAAAFRLDCSREDCVDGGFDYAPFIDKLIQSGAERAHETIACAGWLDSGEGRPHCSLQSEYRIIVQYRH